MASLSATFNVGSTGTSALIKSASSLSTQIASYNDDLRKIQYENSAKTSSDLATYSKYLSTRITNLKGTGTVADATKALNMQQDLLSATHSNISADITRENIQIMAGNSTLSDKYNVIVGEYQRALNVGDDSLAQSLESQAYSVSQTIQEQAQTAADSASTLGKASAAANATSAAEIPTVLRQSLQQLNGDIKTLGITDATKTVGAWVKQNSNTLKALGVVLPQGAQPNYWNIVNGVTGALYNAQMLTSQAYAATNPYESKYHSQLAQSLLSNQTTIPTLAGYLNGQQIQEAEANPDMLTYNAEDGRYTTTKQSGYQYEQFKQPNGQSYTALAPTYSGSLKTTTFLSPTQTNTMTKLGLNFTENNNPTSKNYQTTGNGVRVQTTSATPKWLQDILDPSGEQNANANAYIDPNSPIGGIEFAADNPNGRGLASFTVLSDNKGLHGVYENMHDGSQQMVGGDYGFNAGAVSLLLDQAQQSEHIESVKVAAQQATLKAQAATALSKIKSVSQPKPTQVTPETTNTQVLQPAATKSVVQKTVNPQKTASPQPKTVNPQQTGGGFNLNQSGGGWSIKL